MKAIFKYGNGMQFLGVTTNEEVAIKKLFDLYADKAIYTAENFWGDKERAIKSWWRAASKRAFVIEDVKVWDE